MTRAQRKRSIALAMAAVRLARVASSLSKAQGKRRSGRCQHCGKKKCACGARGRGARSVGSVALGSFALGASAFGAVAIGALAIRALAIRRLAIKRASAGRVEIGELKVGRLEVDELIAPNMDPGKTAAPGTREAAVE
ncbi:MAG: hypothetical protein ACRDK4_02995 [Solirubrobacteraceae bacterium]